MKPIVIPDIDNALIDLVVNPEEYRQRLIALREREEDLQQRENELKQKENDIVQDNANHETINAITKDIEEIAMTAQDIYEACQSTIRILGKLAPRLNRINADIHNA